MKIAFFSTQPYDREYFARFNKHHTLTFFETQLNEQTVNVIQDCDAVCCFVNDRLHASVIKSLAAIGIKIIALRCAGFNNVDLVAAKEHEVAVVRVPAYSPHAVAEHAVALILTLNRKTHKAYNRVREGNFSLQRLTGFDLNGKSVGVIGTGKIGSCFAQIMQGFGCRVLAFDIAPDPDLEKKGVKFLPLTDLFRQSDIVSLHCPLTEETKHLVNKTSLEMMKDGVMLINTSRGGLVDTKATITALKQGKIGYLGIDVYEQEEKLFFYDLSENIIEDEMIMRLMSFPNVLVTAHQGFLTNEALAQIALVTLQNLEDFENKKVLENAV
jgi:D-lactate dehydrogenase